MSLFKSILFEKYVNINILNYFKNISIYFLFFGDSIQYSRQKFLILKFFKEKMKKTWNVWISSKNHYCLLYIWFHAVQPIREEKWCKFYFFMCNTDNSATHILSLHMMIYGLIKNLVNHVDMSILKFIDH